MKKKRIFRVILAVIWGLFIFSQSLKDGDTSGAMSGTIVDFLRQFLPVGEELLHTLIRKGAHFAEYFILGILVSGVFRAFGLFPRKWDFSVLFIGCFWAVLDEFLQTFVPDRAGMVGDVLIDSAGVLCGTALVLLIVCSKKKREEKSCSV